MTRLTSAGLTTLAVALFASAAQAHPLLIEETASIPNPDPDFPYCCNDVAIDGDDVIMLAMRSVPDPEPGNHEDTQVRALHLHRTGDTWTFMGSLGQWQAGNEDDAHARYSVAMRNGVAGLSLGYGLAIFEREGGAYVPRRTTGYANAPTEFLDIDGDNLLFGDGSWGGSLHRRAADGSWPFVQWLPGGNSGDSDNGHGGPVAISGDAAAVLDAYDIDELPTPAMVMFRNIGGTWQQTQRLTVPAGHYLGLMAMSGNVMYAHDDPRFGTQRYYRSTSDYLWRPSGLALRSDGDHRLINSYFGQPGRIAIGSDFVARLYWDPDKNVQVVQVFQFVAPNVIGHVATLAPSDGTGVGDHISVSGRNILVGGASRAWLFTLPAQPRAPALLQQSFDGSADGWQVVAGQFAVAQGAQSRVFRQANVTVEGAAVFTAANWAQQSIQADVTPTAISGADRWVGLATRRSDGANYYYVTLRSSGIIELKRMYHGGFATLDSASVPFVLNRTYRLRLESIGSRHRVYVDGVLVLEALDQDLRQGRPALLTNRAAADFDNVVVSPADLATLWVRNGERVCNVLCEIVDWESADGEWSWQRDGDNEVFAQASLTTAGRAHAGALTRNIDQIVESRARLRAFGAASDPWFGVMARYQDVNNYVYLSLRRSNTVTLRKLVDGQIQELGLASLPVTAGAWYRLRLEAVSDKLRVFVNGRQLLEATDSRPTPGQVGVVTNRAQADFDDFIAVRP